MASFKSENFLTSSQFFILFLLVSTVTSLKFNYRDFTPNTKNIVFHGDAFAAAGIIQLTASRPGGLDSIGRAIYAKPFRLWDSTTGKVADFTIQFSFLIRASSRPDGGGGLAFFLVASGASISPDSGGYCFGLFSDDSKFNSSQIVAIEFDTFRNEWDPGSDHVGIDVNSIRSVATWNSTALKDSAVTALVSYNSSTTHLSVYLNLINNSHSTPRHVLSYALNLKDVLPEWITFGFSASTRSSSETHAILSWKFYSTTGEVHHHINTKLLAGLLLGGFIMIIVMGAVIFALWKMRNGSKDEENSMFDDVLTSLENGTGTKRFNYGELLRATNNFSEEGKLGEGGFGGVYKGFLSDSNVNVAVKRVSKGSKQGKEEFFWEVKIIGHLRHRYLVQLLGWCHEQDELLLVYEYMPNCSLDCHLFKGRSILTWAVRYKIALGLASALLYLHEDLKPYVVHRDVKSSNIMLDEDFNAKLGDFGLARFVDQDVGLNATKVAGTQGYMSPECVVKGKVGKESDVYSFGVVVLEIACGRKAVELKEEESKIGIVSWVLNLYGRGKHLDAVDSRLGMDFDKQQMERLIVVGLWCTSFQGKLRPSMCQAFHVLNSEDALPNLSSMMPVSMDASPSNVPDIQSRNSSQFRTFAGVSAYSSFLCSVPR